MKPLIKSVSLLLYVSAATLLFTECSPDSKVISKQEHEQNVFVSEAQQLFEAEVTRTENIGERKNGLMQLGMMTPVWQMAESSATTDISSIDVPLLTNYRYRAMVTIGEKAVMIPIYQNIVFVKSKTTGIMSQYIHYYIPDATYVRRYKGDLTNRFLNCESRGDLSGIEIYTDLRGVIYRINRYVDGHKTLGVNMSTTSLSDESKRRIVASAIGGLWIQRGKLRETTRATGSEDGEWEWGGRWEYVDKDGNHYTIIDTDGDGNPDSVLVDPVETEGNSDNDNDNDNTPKTEPEPLPDDDIEPPAPSDNVGGGGSGNNGVAEGIDASTLSPNDQQIVLQLYDMLKAQIPLRCKITVAYGATPYHHRAESRVWGLYNAESPIEVTLRSGYNNMQTILILAHEFAHIHLFALMKAAGSEDALKQLCPDLVKIYNDYRDKETGEINYNNAQHEYIAQHPELLESWLRNLNPEAESEFANLGKWAGGLRNTTIYRQLPKSERDQIDNYIKENNLEEE